MLVLAYLNEHVCRDDGRQLAQDFVPGCAEDEAALAASPLAEVQAYWSTVRNRLRDSAKWMAAVLGAALATVVGASPLAGLRAHHLPGIAIGLGLGGLVFLGLTLFLVLQVMRPQSVSFTDVQSAGLGRWPWRPALDAGGTSWSHSKTCTSRAGCRA
jgi:hypothetical protein